MSTTNHPRPDIDEAGGSTGRPEDGERAEPEHADTPARWEDGTAMPYWVAPDDAPGEE